MRLIDFFAGVGCFSIAGHSLGIETVAACEIDKHASACFASHFEGVPNFGDISKAGLERELPDADIWSGGSPCVDVSPAGKRAGLEGGTRSGLVYKLIALASVRRPRWILLENSAGLITTAGGINLWNLLTAIDHIGYRCAWRVLDSQYFGIPQARRRVFILARDIGAGGVSPEEILFDEEGGGRHATARRETWKKSSAGPSGRVGISRAISTRPCQRLDPGAGGVSFVVGAFNAETVTSGENRSSVTPHAPTMSTRGLGSMIGITPQAIDGPGCHADMAPVIGTRNRASVVGFDSKGLMGPGNFGDKSPVLRAEQRAGVAGTICANYGKQVGQDQGNGIVAHGKSPAGYFVRRFTPLECERIQGIPDSWTEGFSDAQRYKMIGNACPPPMIKWILGRLIARS
jgi:DNA (cytosine-5)-methyltransferase 1